MENEKHSSIFYFPFSVFHFRSFSFFFLFLCGEIFLFVSASAAQKLAVLIPVKSAQSEFVRQKLEENLSKNFKVSDDALAETVLFAEADKKIFNLSTEDARNFGSAAGCDFLLLIKSETLRRASLSKADYYESYAAVYLISSRTGRLVFWKLSSFEAESSRLSENKLNASLENLAAEIAANVKSANANELAENPSPRLAELPDENSPAARGFRPPLPYRRLKPVYTVTANLYGVEATVDALVDVDETGGIARIEITRWAGYGLDESVAEIIRKMQWRPASRDGKALPVRVLLRYNFKKLDREE